MAHQLLRHNQLNQRNDRGVVVGIEHPDYRPKDKKPGETIIHDASGQQIYLKDDGSIHIKTNGKLTIDANEKVRVNTPRFEVTGHIIDNVDATGQTMSDMRDIFNIHTHHENDVQGETDQPTQQMGGSS